MENEERIRKWQLERASTDARTTTIEEDPTRAERRIASGRLDRGSAPSEFTDGIGVDDARFAIIQRRRLRWRTILRRTALLAVVPLAAILLYITFFATKLYQGEAVFTVQTSSQSAPAPNAGIFAIGGGGSTIADAFKAREFILSRPMMNYLEARAGFLTHFESFKMDPLQRLRSPLGLNRDPYDYYRKRVRVAVDVQEGILRLYVQARTEQDAINFGNVILAAAEQHVNNFSDKISHDQINALTQDVQNAERQVADARRSLATVQARRGDLSPEQTATSVYQLIGNLEVQLAEAERERSTLLDQGLTESPLLPRLTARTEELRSQIAEQRGRLANPGGGSLVRTLNEYETASSRKEIAQARWESTLKTLQEAYLRILEQRRYFVIVVGMSVSTFPKVRDVMTIAWPILLLLGLIYSVSYAIRRNSARRVGSGQFSFSRIAETWQRR